VKSPQPKAEQQPGRETAPAASHPLRRDFDGGLLDRREFTLTRADALAYLRLRHELPGRAKVALGVWFMLGGAASGLLPETITGAPDTPRYIAVFLAVIALQFCILLLGREIWRHLKARRMVPRPRPAVFEEWIDCIAGTDLNEPDDAYLSHELIGQVLQTRDHIFVLNWNTALIIPNSAFADLAEATAMAQHLRELAAGPYYFDA
jgi:hypothetical protein